MAKRRITKPEPVVVEATQDFVLKITQADVNKALKMRGRKDETACAIACALLRLPGVQKVRADRAITLVKMSDGKWHRYRTPQSLRDQIILFDRAGIFDPGDYALKRPSKSFTRVSKAAYQMHGAVSRKRNRPHHWMDGVRAGADPKYQNLE